MHLDDEKQAVLQRLLAFADSRIELNATDVSRNDDK